MKEKVVSFKTTYKMIIFVIDYKAIMVEMYFNLQMKMTHKICPKFSAKFRSR